MPSPGLELASALYSLVKHTYIGLLGLCYPHTWLNQRTDMWGAVTRPIHVCVATSLSLMRTLIRSSDEDRWHTVHVHPDCPSLSEATLQDLANDPAESGPNGTIHS